MQPSKGAVAPPVMTTKDDNVNRRGPSGGLACAPYPASAVANFFLCKGEAITQMKLHKLLYYAQGWYLAVVGKPLLNETISAWKHGPVAPSLYYDLKKFGARPVDRLAKTTDRRTRLRYAPKVNEVDHLVRGLLERIWSVYGGLSGRQLSQLTHAPDSPWSKVREQNPELFGVDIPNERICDHFRARLAGGERD